MVIKIAEGAEAIAYEARVLGFDAVIKSRIKKDYRIEEIDEHIRSSRTKNEARLLSVASSVCILVPSVLFVGRYDICMSKVKGKNLNTMLKSKKINDAIFSLLGAYAAMLHNAGIAHGDYTPANVLIGSDNIPWIIDFGLAEATFSLEEEAIDLLLMKRSINKGQFCAFIDGYRKRRKNSVEVLKRLAAIEKRGRYQTRTLLADANE